MASVVGASVGSVSERSTSDSASPSRRTPPKRSFESRPRNATWPPSRPIVRAVLNGPPPGTAVSRPSGWTRMSMSASPATTIMRPIVRGATYAGAMDRHADAVELLDGPLDDPATLAGNLRDLRRINRWLGGVRLSGDAIDALAAHRDSLTVLDVGTGGADIPMALLARADGRAAVACRSSASTAGPRSSRPRSWRHPRSPRRRGWSCTSVTAGRSRTATGRSTSSIPRC